MKDPELTGKLVCFVGDNGNEFKNGEIAVCLNGESGLFLGLNGSNFGRVWYESLEYIVIETKKDKIEDLMAEARNKYYLA